MNNLVKKKFIRKSLKIRNDCKIFIRFELKRKTFHDTMKRLQKLKMVRDQYRKGNSNGNSFKIILGFFSNVEEGFNKVIKFY